MFVAHLTGKHGCAPFMTSEGLSYSLDRHAIHRPNTPLYDASGSSFPITWNSTAGFAANAAMGFFPPALFLQPRNSGCVRSISFV